MTSLTTTITINGFDITLPLGLPRGMETKVRDGYQDFLKEDTSLVRRHLTAATTLIPKYLPKDTTRVLHVFGGVGASAQIVDQALGRKVQHVFWERDPVLVEYLNKTFPDATTVLTEDSYSMFLEENPRYLALFDVILFDPSVGTIKNKLMPKVWDRMSFIQPGMIWLSDTACAKIHLNYAAYTISFGSPVEPTAEGYLKAYDTYLRTFKNLHIADAMREAAETYAVIMPGKSGQSFPQPIPYM